jgi:hypothetical protein
MRIAGGPLFFSSLLLGGTRALARACQTGHLPSQASGGLITYSIAKHILLKQPNRDIRLYSDIAQNSMVRAPVAVAKVGEVDDVRMAGRFRGCDLSQPRCTQRHISSIL